MTETRAEEAQRLVDEGYVAITSPSEFGVCGLVLGKEAVHSTFVKTNGHFFCDCDWGRDHNNTDDLCAHALAVKLAAEREQGP